MMERMRGSLLLGLANAGSTPTGRFCCPFCAAAAAVASALRSRDELNGSRHPATMVPAIFRQSAISAQ